MRQLSKITSLVSLARIPSLSSFLPGVHARRAALDDERGDALGAGSAIGHRHRDHDVSPTRPCVVNVFEPFSTQHVARARRRGPHAGGVAAGRRLRSGPRRRSSRRAPAAPGNCCFCSSVPNIADVRRAEAVVRGDRQRERRDRRARAPRCRCSSRSPTSPAPPYCSGNWMPISPSAASFGSSSAGKCCASSHSRTCGRISVSANSRTVRRSSCLLLGRAEVHTVTLSKGLGGGGWG